MSETGQGTTLTWMTRAEFNDLGFRASAPEIDYGMRWGEAASVRVSFAPAPGSDRGYLYAHDARNDRYALLCVDVPRADVEAAWEMVVADPPTPTGYITLASIAAGTAPLEVEEAHRLWLHCLDREFAARQTFQSRRGDRGTAAQRVVVSESARMSAENLLFDALRAERPLQDPPVILRYRVLNGGGWTGRVYSRDATWAVRDIERVQEGAQRYGFVVQPTSLAHGRNVRPASRVPELRPAVARADAMRQPANAVTI